MKLGDTRLLSLTRVLAPLCAGTRRSGADVVPSHCNAEGLRPAVF
jgi:hypothetical protein